MAHTPLKMTIAEAHAEVKRGWSLSYHPKPWRMPSVPSRPAARLPHQHLHRANVFPRNLFPQMGPLAWLKVIYKTNAQLRSRTRRLRHLAQNTPLVRPAPPLIRAALVAKQFLSTGRARYIVPSVARSPHVLAANRPLGKIGRRRGRLLRRALRSTPTSFARH